MKKILLALLILFAGLQGFAAAEEPAVSNAPDLAALKKSWEESRSNYRNALKGVRDGVQKEIDLKENALEKEGNGGTRKTILDALRSLRSERDDLNSKIREINASDVVKFATGRDKILAALTGQTPA